MARADQRVPARSMSSRSRHPRMQPHCPRRPLRPAFGSIEATKEGPPAAPAHLAGAQPRPPCAVLFCAPTRQRATNKAERTRAYAGEQAFHRNKHRARSSKEPSRVASTTSGHHPRGSSPAGPSGSGNAHASAQPNRSPPRPRVRRTGTDHAHARAHARANHPYNARNVLRTPRRAQPRSWLTHVLKLQGGPDPTYPPPAPSKNNVARGPSQRIRAAYPASVSEGSVGEPANAMVDTANHGIALAASGVTCQTLPGSA